MSRGDLVVDTLLPELVPGGGFDVRRQFRVGIGRRRFRVSVFDGDSGFDTEGRKTTFDLVGLFRSERLSRRVPEFDSVIGSGIVRGGDADASIGTEPLDAPGECGRRDDAESDDVDPKLAQAGGDGIGQDFTSDPSVPADDHRLGIRTDRPSEVEGEPGSDDITDRPPNSARPKHMDGTDGIVR